jgi:hypothetical protein
MTKNLLKISNDSKFNSIEDIVISGNGKLPSKKLIDEMTYFFKEMLGKEIFIYSIVDTE